MRPFGITSDNLTSGCNRQFIDFTWKNYFLEMISRAGLPMQQDFDTVPEFPVANRMSSEVLRYLCEELNAYHDPVSWHLNALGLRTGVMTNFPEVRMSELTGQMLM